MARKQLWRLSNQEFQVLASWSPENGIRRRRVGRIPFICWPDKHWCLEANLYMARLLERGYSTRGTGGTLETKAAYLTPLIRHCSFHGRPFHQLTDSMFCEIVLELYAAKRSTRAGVVVANNNTSARKITTTWLDFLHFVGELRGNPAYVSKNGSIEATQEVTEVNKGGRDSYSFSAWSHKAIAVGDAERHRLPITEKNIQLLRESASNSEGAFVKIRRLVMLELFDAVGLRRMEASFLPAYAVQNAVLSSKAGGADFSAGAYLEFVPVKKGLVRRVPLAPATLAYFSKYLRLLKLRVQQLGQKFNEETPFFINAKTGKALTPNTFTFEFWELAVEANIADPCSPHLVRHRYIVREFVRLIVAHEMEAKDDFRKMLINSEAFLRKVQEITGHASLDSLTTYINLAFEEVGELSVTVSRVEMQSHLDALSRAKQRYSADIAAGISYQEAAEELYAAVDATLGQKR
jgi:site-specific recombinase XerD